MDYNIVNKQNKSIVEMVIKRGWSDILEMMPDIKTAAASDNEDIGKIKTETKIYGEENGTKIAQYVYKMKKMAEAGSAANNEEYTKLALAYQNLMKEIMKDLGN